MTTQVGIKIEPELLKLIKVYAKSHGTTLSSLMRQATIEHIQRNNGAYTEEQLKKSVAKVGGF